MNGSENIGGGSSGTREPVSYAPSELVELALAEDVSGDRHRELVVEISRRDLDEVLALAAKLLAGQVPSERTLGADILGAMASSGIEGRRVAATPPLLGAVEGETDPEVLAAAATGLGHAAEGRALDPLLRLVEHEAEEVREAVAFALPDILRSRLDDRGVNALIKLTTDPDDDVRDWATFGLGVQRQELNNPDIRRALHERREDENFAVRCEALEGLGIRGDIEALAEALRFCDAGIEAVMVAEKAATPELYEPLLALKSRSWGGWIEDIERAIAACRPEQKGEGLV